MVTKYCDLVMKGGITSGLVYPAAALALSKTYRFKNIGGTSAGAIAAAVCAAAAVGDRKRQATTLSASLAGFDGLQSVADELTSEKFIYHLFQPAKGAGNAYRFLVIFAASPKSWFQKLRKAFAPFLAILSIAPTRTALVFAVLMGLAYVCAGVNGLFAAALPALCCTIAAGALFSIHKVAGIARRNRLGLCSGRSVKRWLRPHRLGLTDWLHERLQSLSAKPLDAPLTFRDLWEAPRYAEEPATPNAVTLQMITTCVSHNEPRSVPFENGAFWFLRRDFDLLFPQTVVDWLVSQAPPPKIIDGLTYYRLPMGADLPVLVGMRMSLSFPFLISAIPLYEPHTWTKLAAPETEAPEDVETRQEETTVLASAAGLNVSGRTEETGIASFRVCWFSDGGISSNFPVHLFDAPLPHWPTFAIDLADKAPDGASGPNDLDDVYLPKGNNEGWQRRYTSIAAASPLSELGHFLFGIIGTMQNWRDLLQSRAPGYRDRIVQVRLTVDEGGLNLNMPQPTLSAIAGKGTHAGEALADFDFDNHYWIRWRNLAAAVQSYAKRLADIPQPSIPEFQTAFDLGKTATTEPPSYPFSSQARRDEAIKLVNDLADKGREWADDKKIDVTAGAPRPRPQITITPTY